MPFGNGRAVLCLWHLLNGFQFSISKLVSLLLYSISETNKNVILQLVSGVIIKLNKVMVDLYIVLFLPASQRFHPEFLCRSLFFLEKVATHSSA